MAKKDGKKRNPNGSGTIGPRKDGRYELKLFLDTPDGRRKRISVYRGTVAPGKRPTPNGLA